MSRRRWWSRGAALAVSAAAAAALVIPGSGVTPEPSSPVRTTASGAETPVLDVYALSKYVSLGSSYAAGPAVSRLHTVCQRSADNYPHQVAAALGMRLSDASCSGARTVNILRVPQRPLRMPQISAVTPDTRLVTITTGGNDLDYMGRLLAMGCANSDPRRISPLTARACARPKPIRPEPVARDYVAVEQSIAATVGAVRARAPHALVVIVDYLPLGPVGQRCAGLALTPAQAISTRRVYDALVAATARAAAASDAVLVRASRAGAGHGVCSKSPWLSGFGTGGVSYHPNAQGKTAVADLVLAALRQPSTVAEFVTLGVLPASGVVGPGVAPSR
ncbi:SGNH/GDSL hydrolase family protein [Gordonia bronchialis]|uniref:SGNH/GDSL hydrolase family protein n=1 Tax=Gordonia bronchialis TaxID=2054 RepID=UPI002271EC1C|nr:SGNH/GDSL hydrolase family protein [Gordonia bronchialis]